MAEKEEEKKKSGNAFDPNAAQADLEAFVRAQLEAAQKGVGAGDERGAPESADSGRMEARDDEATPDSSGEEMSEALTAQRSAPEDENASSEAEEAVRAEEKGDAAGESAAEPAEEGEAADGADESSEEESEYEDLEAWAAQQLAEMEAGDVDDPSAAPEEPGGEQGGGKVDPSEMTPEDMEKWAASQLAAMGEEEGAPAEGVEETPERVATGQQAVAGGAFVEGGIAQTTAFHLHPLHAAVFLVVAMVPAALTGWILSSRTTAAQRASIGEFKKTISEMEKRLALIKARELGISEEKMRQRLTIEDLKNFVKLGDAHLLEGHIKEAQRLYLSAIDGDKAGKYTDGAHYGLGMCYLKTDQPEKAAEEFRAVVTRFPGSPKYGRAAVALGELLMRQENYTQARRLYYRVLARKDRFTADDAGCVEQAYYAIAKCYEGEAAAVERSRSMASQVVDTGLATPKGE